MTRLFHPFLALIASSTDRALARYIEYLKAENKILRARIPGQVHTKPAERKQLLKLGKIIGKAIEELISIVTPATFYRWVRDESEEPRKKRAKGGRRKPQELRDLVVEIAKQTGFGYTRIEGYSSQVEDVRDRFFRWPNSSSPYGIDGSNKNLRAVPRAEAAVALLRMWSEIEEPVSQFIGARIRDGHNPDSYQQVLGQVFQNLPGLDQRPRMSQWVIEKAIVLSKEMPQKTTFVAGNGSMRKRSEFRKLRTGWNTIMRTFSISLPQQPVHAVNGLMWLDPVEQELLSLPSRVDFHTAATAVSQNRSSLLFAPYRSGLIGFFAWRLTEGDDAENLSASLGDLLRTLCIKHAKREKEAIVRQGEKVSQHARDQAEQKVRRRDLAVRIAERLQQITSVKQMIPNMPAVEQMPLLRVVEEMEHEQEEDTKLLNDLDPGRR